MLQEQKNKMTFFHSELQDIKIKKHLILGCSEEDHKRIADIDNICLNALNVLKSALNM